MTKQSQAQSHVSPEEKPSAELLMRRFKLMDEVVEVVRKANIEAGLDSKLMGYYIMYDSNDTPEKKKYQNWLAKVTNKRTGKFNQIKDLRARELIPEDEISEYEDRTYPYRRLDALCKIKTGDNKIWLMRHESWFGLDAAGQEVNVSVNDLDYIRKPVVTYERIPKDPRELDGPTIRVGKITTHMVWTAEQPGPKTYLTAYSLDKVSELLKYAGPLDNHGNGTALMLEKEGVSNPVSATYDQFIAEDFDSTFDRIRAPAPDFNDFYKEYKKRAKEAAEDEHQQYG